MVRVPRKIKVANRSELGGSQTPETFNVIGHQLRELYTFKKMKPTLVFVVSVFLIATGMVISRRVRADTTGARTPVLVELFTSEGCSSCPPADRLLEQYDRQPTAGAELIVLSEHVDYWNHIGWKDPYSAQFFSERQSGYVRRFGLVSVYTPQLVVDGNAQFVGSDSGKATRAFTRAISRPKVSVVLSHVNVDASHMLHGHIEVGKLEPSYGSAEAEVYIAIALNRAQSQVSAGENAGRRLSHTAVVKNLTTIGVLKRGQSMAKDVELRLEPGSNVNNLRLIAFVQEPGQGLVLGATLVQVVPKQ
jgi:hypothetical protein